MIEDFKKATDTVVLSDIHLADIEETNPKRPLWKRFKARELQIDASFQEFLRYIQAHRGEANPALQGRVNSNGPIELVLNGDIFDFDSVMKVPKDFQGHLNWLERIRGLSSEEAKSRFKLKVILDDHPVWIAALRDFILAGNRVIFVIGNHDMELHWLSARQDILDRLQLPVEKISSVRFCEWFYISNADTLIEHGNQYDAYCLCSNPIHPLIKMGSKIQVRIPFGNLAGKFMVNGMGLMNPHANSSFIKESVWEYITFYFKYMIRTQPLLLWTWFWSAIVTLVVSLTEGFLPAISDPLTVDSRLEDIATRANTTVYAVLALKEVHAHPAIFNPIKIMRELWLDRALLLGLIFVASFQFVTFLNIFTRVSLGWLVLPAAILMPGFIFYASSVQSEVKETENRALKMVPLSAKIARVGRVVNGHTHRETHTEIEGVELLNTGTWSPAYHDVECTQPYGRKCFAWIRSDAQLLVRHAHLYEWTGKDAVLIQKG